MAPPPAKRQKRLVVLSSDEEDEGEREEATSPVRLKRTVSVATAELASNGIAKRSLPSRSRTKPTSTKAELDTSPKKTTRNSNVNARKSNSKPISSFFDSADKPLRLIQRPPPIASQEAEDEVEDIIDDISPDDDTQELQETRNITKVALDRRKRPLGEKIPNASQRFKLASNTVNRDAYKTTGLKDVDLRPWAERFGPDGLEELVVHKKKVSDVRNWLEHVFHGRDRKSLLIMKGPSGSGKTATMSTLAKAMNFELSEWRNPVGSEYSSEGYLSMSAQFQEFIGRSGAFGTLDLSDSIRSTRELRNPDKEKPIIQRKVILLEEFPNTFLSTSSALRSFRSSILEYLSIKLSNLRTMQAKPLSDIPTPVVMIITETRMTTTTAASDSFTAHRLLGSDILSHPGVSVIEFNPVASTLLTKALDLVIRKEARQSGRRRIPGPSVLRRLGEVGDVRSAIGSLEFLCLRGEDGEDWGGRVASGAKKGANSSAITKMERESLGMLTQRESSLGLFHAVGKVVYNKRDDVTEAIAQPPSHMLEHSRNRVSQVLIESLIDETGTDTGTFIAALHENYPLSCEGSSFIDIVNNCLENLSDSDVLGSLHGGRLGSNGEYGGRSFQGAASDSLRQDEICFQVAVRGLLFSLPDPVKRRAHPIAGKSGGKNDTYKIFYPTSMRLSRQIEEVDDHVERWLGRLRAGFPVSQQPASARGHQFALVKTKDKEADRVETGRLPPQGDQEEVDSTRTSLNCTKAELVLERLPYITKIQQQNPASSTLRDLKKITQFHGIDVPNEESSEDEATNEPVPASEWTTDRPADLNVASHQQPIGQAAGKAHAVSLPVEEEVEKTFLSDDDIED